MVLMLSSYIHGGVYAHCPPPHSKHVTMARHTHTQTHIYFKKKLKIRKQQQQHKQKNRDHNTTPSQLVSWRRGL